MLITHPRFIFDHHGKRFFRCMAKIYGWQKNKQIREAESYNVGKPLSKRRKVPYWKEIPRDPCESSDTCSSSSAADKCPFFERSWKITPHALVHFADQVMMGGTHNFHNTAAAESSHPRCIAQASLRSKTYHDVNLSGQKMLEYLINKNKLRKIIQSACKYDLLIMSAFLCNIACLDEHHLWTGGTDTQQALVQSVIPDGGPFPLQSLSLSNHIQTAATLNRGNRGLALPSQRIHQTSLYMSLGMSW